MPKLMRCAYCGLLQDEPAGVKSCSRCGGELTFEGKPALTGGGYLEVQMELDQVAAPAGQNVERYLLVTLRSPKEVPADEMPPAKASRPPVNFTAVLDISGSMGGEKILQAKQAVRQAVQHLRPGDVFSLVTFHNYAECRLEPVQVDAGFRQAVEACLGTVRATGSTALDAGLEMGISKALAHPLETSLVMLLSDGQTNIGELDLEKIGARALAARQQHLIVSALGIGADYNEALLTEIATQGGGRFYHIQNAQEIPAYVAGELGEVAMLAARDVRLTLAVPPGATLIPLSAAYPVQQAGGEALVSVGDLPCETELEVPLRLALVGGAAGSKLSITGSVSFRSPVGREHTLQLNRVTVRFVEQGTFNLREGVIAPVVERVLGKLKDASVLGMSRSMAHKPGEVQERTRISVESLRAYASLLGEERAQAEVREMSDNFTNLASSPAAAKFMVSDAFKRERSRKDFHKS